MRIEDYFDTLRTVIDTSPIVQSASVTYDKRSTYIGFIRGTLYLLDGSRLHFREFVNVEAGVDRYMYAYQYQRTEEEFIFRYDNTDHHRALNPPTHPHHKHNGQSGPIVASSAPTLDQVLIEIEGLVELPDLSPSTAPAN